MSPIPEIPPGLIIRTEAQKAAWDNGFRLPRDGKDGWLAFNSTTAEGKIWIAGIPPIGPWFLGLERANVAAKLSAAQKSPIIGPGHTRFQFASLSELYSALDRAYHLSISLPDAPLVQFKAQTANLPRSTEAERLTVQRIGQNLFRDALMAYWGGACPLTGITDPALLRASHIISWAECSTDAERLDVHNGLLLSSLWDAAFDSGLVGFADDGSVLTSPDLSGPARQVFGVSAQRKIDGLSDVHLTNLARHRQRHSLG